MFVSNLFYSWKFSCRKIVSEQKKSEVPNEVAASSPDIEGAEEEPTIEEQESKVADKLQRLNLYFEKENVIQQRKYSFQDYFIDNSIFSVSIRPKSNHVKNTWKLNEIKFWR